MCFGPIKASSIAGSEFVMLALSMVSLELCLKEVVRHLSLSMACNFQCRRSKAITAPTIIIAASGSTPTTTFQFTT